MIHVFNNCAGLKIPVKYRYTKDFRLGDTEGARRLDALVRDEGYKICHACYGREHQLARQDKRRPRPGFRSPPAGYKHPVPRPRGPRKPNVDRG